jgi:nitrite reductase/ring-hydroxylating ferredoxin subunit
MMLVRVGDERVVLGRCPEGMIAFSDHCTHKGGALSDGALVGCTVQCPWHGSQFDTHTGRVIAGPAKNKIDIYETQTRAGEVYVMPKSSEKPEAA